MKHDSYEMSKLVINDANTTVYKRQGSLFLNQKRTQRRIDLSKTKIVNILTILVLLKSILLIYDGWTKQLILQVFFAPLWPGSYAMVEHRHYNTVPLVHVDFEKINTYYDDTNCSFCISPTKVSLADFYGDAGCRG